MVAVCTVLVLTLANIVASLYLLDFALSPEKRSKQEAIELFREKNPQLKLWLDSLVATGALRDTFVVINGDRQHAHFVVAPKPSAKVAMLVHGYKNSSVSMLNIGNVYLSLGYNIFLPDLYAHGQSEGDHIQMGWNDRVQVMEWMSIANERFKGDFAQSQMVLHGVSMGAATVMSVSGEKLPDYVKCLVEDCGYTGVYDEFAHELSDTALLKTPFAIPQWPLLSIAGMLCKVKYGWNFEQASMIEQVKKCTLPMLFIHGDSDDFVPSKMVYPLYAAKRGKKELYIARNSAHAKSIHDHPTEYRARVKAFVSKYISLH